MSLETTEAQAAARAAPAMSPRLEIVPVSFRQACAFIAEHHRHHKPPRGMKFCLGVAAAGELVGVATVGRPIARAYDDGLTLEVNRTCTISQPNANSMLYGAAWRAAKALGYRRLVTYTYSAVYGPLCEDATMRGQCSHGSCTAIVAGESGASLRAAGWVVIAERPARESWADSSVTLRHLRDPEGPGGVQRSLWNAASPQVTGPRKKARKTHIDDGRQGINGAPGTWDGTRHVSQAESA